MAQIPAAELPHYDRPLVVAGLSAGYDGQPVVQDVSLQVAAAEIRVILGASGGGKSTLLKALVGLLPAQAGTISLLGVPLQAGPSAQLEVALGRVGMLFQNGALLGSMTALDNVALPLRERTQLPPDLILEVARMKLALVAMEGAAAMMPAQLSGGMRKRVALARALALDPELLFCDEPSAGLDPNTAADLDALILSLRDQFGMAILVVTHELASIQAIADTVTMLAGGRVLAAGQLKDVQASTQPSVRAFFDRTPQPTRAERPPSVLEQLLAGGAT